MCNAAAAQSLLTGKRSGDANKVFWYLVTIQASVTLLVLVAATVHWSRAVRMHCHCAESCLTWQLSQWWQPTLRQGIHWANKKHKAHNLDCN